VIVFPQREEILIVNTELVEISGDLLISF